MRIWGLHMNAQATVSKNRMMDDVFIIGEPLDSMALGVEVIGYQN